MSDFKSDPVPENEKALSTFEEILGRPLDDEPTEEAVEQARKDAHDEVSRIVLDHYREAALHRNQHMLGQFSVNEHLMNCYNQYHGVITPDIAQLMEDAGVQAHISITRYKVDILNAWMRDLFQNSAEAPITIMPTPIPDLSDKAMEEVHAKIRKAMTNPQGADTGAPPPPQSMGEAGAEQVPPEDMFEWIKSMKKYQLKLEQDVATERALAMQKKIEDQMSEGGFREQLLDFLNNFVLYPYAVMYGPVVEQRPVLQWKGAKPVEKFEKTLVVRNISPFDYFYSSDTRRGGEGAYDIIRERVSREYLKQCMELDGFIKANVEAALQDYDRLQLNSWLTPDPDDMDNFKIYATNTDNTVTILRYFGKMSGRLLKEYGITGVADTDFVEVEALTLDRFTLRIVVNRQPIACGRPIYVTSYNKTPGVLPGYGVAQTLRDIERAYSSSLRSTLANAAFSAAPMGEVDASRIGRYMQDGAVTTPIPGTLIPTDPDEYGHSRPAYTFYSVPNATNQMMSLMSYFLDLADRITGLPAALSGQPVGTGVNRTARGVAQLYAHALKGVQSALTNIDKDVFQPLGENFFVYNMRYDKDEDIKGDCKVVARGTSGLLQKEIAKQQSLDLLQMLGPLVQAQRPDGRPMVPTAVVASAIKNAVIAAGISKEEYEAGVEEDARMAAAQQAAQQQMAMQQNVQAPDQQGVEENAQADGLVGQGQPM